MTGCDDAARGDVQAAVATMIRWVAKEDACRRACAELVRRRGAEVGEAEATKHAQLVVAWRGAEEQFMRRQGIGGAARPAIQQVRRVLRASAQYAGGAPLWINKVLKQSLIVRRTRLALPFCCDVYGQERRSEIP